MSRRYAAKVLLVLVFVGAALLPAVSQSFRVQCPASTITHPTAASNNSEAAYNGPTTFAMGAGGIRHRPAM
jgi:hypothetical protein